MVKNLKKVTLYNHILMLLTSVHHIYGAAIYNTPWRLHVLFLSIPVVAITAVSTAFIKKQTNFRTSFLFWLNWAVILVASIALIGVFEGMYNHLLKNILFFGGLDQSVLLALFPPPTYEMPNDLVFEITGISQAIVTCVLIVHFVRLTAAESQGAQEIK